MKTPISCILGIFVVMTGAMAQMGRVRGWVTTSDGRRAAGASVVLMETSPLRGGIVKSDGSYFVANVRPGRYRVTLKAIGYRCERIDSIDVLPDEETKLDAVIFAPPPHLCVCRASFCGCIPECNDPLHHGDTIIILPPAGDSARKLSPLFNDNFSREKSDNYPTNIPEHGIGIYPEIISRNYSRC